MALQDLRLAVDQPHCAAANTRLSRVDAAPRERGLDVAHRYRQQRLGVQLEYSERCRKFDERRQLVGGGGEWKCGLVFRLASGVVAEIRRQLDAQACLLWKGRFEFDALDALYI